MCAWQRRPRVPSGRAEEARVEFTDQLVAKSRAFPTTGCAYSFPSAAESDRYHYGNEQYPGALLLVLQG